MECPAGCSPEDLVRLARPFKVIAFDWDGTAVMGRQEDASAVNAVVRTSQSGQFPPPPSPAYGDLDMVFTLDELMGR